MLDRWSQEIIAFILSGVIAFGLPFGIIEYFQPHYSEFGTLQGVEWSSVLRDGILMSLFGIVFYSLPVALIRTLAKFVKDASTVLIGAIVQMVGLATTFAIAGTYNWWGSHQLVLGGLALICGVGASVLLHRALTFNITIEKN